MNKQDVLAAQICQDHQTPFVFFDDDDIFDLELNDIGRLPKLLFVPADWRVVDKWEVDPDAAGFNFEDIKTAWRQAAIKIEEQGLVPGFFSMIGLVVIAASKPIFDTFDAESKINVLGDGSNN